MVLIITYEGHRAYLSTIYVKSIFSKAEVYSNIKYIFGTQEPFSYIMTPIILLSSL